MTVIIVPAPLVIDFGCISVSDWQIKRFQKDNKEKGIKLQITFLETADRYESIREGKSFSLREKPILEFLKEQSKCKIKTVTGIILSYDYLSIFFLGKENNSLTEINSLYDISRGKIHFYKQIHTTNNQ